MLTTNLVSDDGTFQVWDILDNGTKIGTNIQPSPGTYVANELDIVTRAENALKANENYLAIAAPTSAQAIAQVTLLTKECNGIIRLLLHRLTTTTGT